MTITNVNSDRIIQLGYEGEDKVTILRFSYSEKWLENGDGIFTVRVLRNGENKAYNAQIVDDDRENSTIDMTVTDVELSKKGYGEMQLVYTGADFVKKSQVYKYYVSRSVDDAVDPPEGDVYTQIIESLADLRVDFNELSDMVSEVNDDIGDLAELTTTNKLNIVESINEVNAKGFVSVDDELSDVSTNPVQNKVITSRIASAESAIQGKADIQTVTTLSDTVADLQTELAEKVGDVQVNGISVVTDGVAQIPVMSESNYGVAKILNDTDYGIKLSTVGNVSDALTTSPASASQIKRGAASYNPIAPINQHYAVFYGLANAAGQNERNSELPLGQYTDEAKTAIQNMLDVPSNNNVVSDVQVDDVSVVTDGIANIPVAGRNVTGVASIRTEYGISILNKSLCISYASQGQCKGGGTSIGYNPITPQNQHLATFYGLAKVAGHDEKDSALTVGEYTDEAKTAIQTMLDVPSTNTVSTLSDAVNGLNTDVQGLQTTKADKSYVDEAISQIPTGSVDDVQIDGTSVVEDGIAVIPVANGNDVKGLMYVAPNSGLRVLSTGQIAIKRNDDSSLKLGANLTNPIVCGQQHISAFYGLAKAAGYDEKNSTLPVGTYSEEAKTAIRTMLGLQDVYDDYSSALEALGGGE